MTYIPHHAIHYSGVARQEPEQIYPHASCLPNASTEIMIFWPYWTLKWHWSRYSCLTVSLFHQYSEMGILRHTHLQIKQTLSVTNDYTLGNYFKAIWKTAYRGSTDLLQNKNNIKPQNTEKKITSFPICSMCEMDIQPFR